MLERDLAPIAWDVLDLCNAEASSTVARAVEVTMASYGSKTLSSGLGGAIAARCCRLLNRAHKTRKDHAEEQR